ncbi:hypothetical protein MMH89_01745 [Candidatus Comchoanobacter bicostacola]|uniref:Uncharacterized protein n=1 Tax=Candidatus Comchoanobacter bicostacola TaxID=2919598 RepID=A0ABY5DK54_9GAMM|nr:hypothetical protein [Candidatus Comchoanobacter bicostacola]UTC24873.1 hypothetical protein MMH89_01745 [Candidatus Comchoanobacter bicostacola]
MLVLSQIFALFLTVVGLGMIINAKLFVDAFNEIKSNPGLRLITGLMPILLGSVVIAMHSVWVMAWPVLVTLIGYTLFILGSLRYLFWKQWVNMMARVLSKSVVRSMGVVALAIGLVLGYYSIYMILLI